MLNGIEQRTAEFIGMNGLFAEARRILLAVSGGADSIALLHILKTLRSEGILEAELWCAHVNHQLRGTASEGDEQFAIDQATQLNLPAVTRTVDVRTYAEQYKLSVETAGRQLRLMNLSEIARAHGCAWVATGHQKNDNAETVLQRLRRGTGFRGLAGMWPARQFGDGPTFARPLLGSTRNEIIQYLTMRGLRWREDRTNADVTYTRNDIRHRLLPTLQQESHGDIVEELCALAASAKRLYDQVRQRASDAWLTMTGPARQGVAIDTGRLLSLPQPVSVELIRLALAKLGCGERDVTQYHYRSISGLARQRRGGKSLTLPGGFVARYELGHVILEPQTSRSRALEGPTEEVRLKIPGKTRIAGFEVEANVLKQREVEKTKLKRDRNRFVEYFDAARVSRPIVVRRRRPGDRFRPLGLPGEKKVGKFLTAAKAPGPVRQQILIFHDGQKIIWVCPVRASEDTKVIDSTTQLLRLEVRVG